MGNANLQTNLAGKVRHLRSMAEISQSALAERSGLTKSQITRIESGMGNPTLTTIMALASAFDVAPHVLFDEPPVD